MSWRTKHRKDHPPSYPHQLNCQACGTTFGAKRSTTKYCSDACRMKAYRARRAAKRTASPQATGNQTKRQQIITITCRQCGATATLNGTQRTRKYCNNACKQAFYRLTNFGPTQYQKSIQEFYRKSP